MLDVARLRVLDAVARHGSVTAAARELDYSQSSVGHHLGRLEAETGAQLPQRAGRGIRLTGAGQLLADRAAEIIGRIHAADAELSAHVGLTAGRVRVASFASAIGSLVVPSVGRAGARTPGLEIGSIDAGRHVRSGGDGGPATAAQLHTPVALSAMADGSVLIDWPDLRRLLQRLQMAAARLAGAIDRLSSAGRTPAA